MKLKVHLLNVPNDEALTRLRDQLHPEVSLTVGKDLPDAPDFHVLVDGRPGREHLTASPDLHTLIIPWAGLPEETWTLMHQFPHITVHNLHHNAVPMAELAFALLLSAAKFVVPFDQLLRRHDWTPRYQPTPARLLNGKTALILGYGAIGQQVARLCHAFGMRVLATKRDMTILPGDESEVHPPEHLPDLLPRTHALIVCLPLTQATKGLIGAKELALMPEGGVLVNIGRGPIVDEAALYHALSNGGLHAAGLDVWYNYPGDTENYTRTHTPPANFPFHELDNVVMSPHRGGASNESDRLRMTHLADLLNTAAQGDPMPNRVDLEAGY